MTSADPQLLIPALATLYRPLQGLALPLVRITAGLLLVPHGAQKLFGAFGGGGLTATAASFAKIGFEPGLPVALLIGVTEFFGGWLLALGLFTRPAAVAIAIFLAVAVSFHWSNGLFWNQGGFEYPLLWALVATAFAIMGGGRYSLDARIGREF